MHTEDLNELEQVCPPSRFAKRPELVCRCRITGLVPIALAGHVAQHSWDGEDFTELDDDCMSTPPLDPEVVEKDRTGT